jgi:hypothetical protein
MKLKAIAAAAALMGLGASVAVAKEPLPVDPAARGSVLVCHRTEAAARPFRLIRVARSAVEGHMRHGDILATRGGCPATMSAAP